MAEADQNHHDHDHDHNHDQGRGHGHADEIHSHSHGHVDGSHSHSHPPGRQDDETVADVNRTYFNKTASSYNLESWKDFVNKITAFVHQHIDWIGVDFVDPSNVFETNNQADPDPDGQGRRVRVLDYACGPGSMTQALGARATEYIGIDLSENMVLAYNLRFGPASASHSPLVAEGLEPEPEAEPFNAHAVVGNLLSPSDPSPQNLSSPEFFEFDLVVVGMAFHHFPNIPLATRRLVERLRPGGVFLIIDFVTFAMENHGVQPAAKTVTHHGFSERELRQYFEDAGLSEFAVVRMGEEISLPGSMKREPFLARGRKTSLA
ncbi:hypothetical protein A1O3_08092 [Capronia epimyces CBS 606.96]|uniref:Methyltransferase type 11 domain-containing protein n=1 Tax=Capronia epimyces CBS 606.96 TaxID=1182542 RepID=W9XH13_9EURO|nr:uncharacterized protein A1O3_08092 [Capronia epimyces CBS 606.96]EXJ79807.1 hypothetical protein A1O3_08092 [Capronia epimyces CBS 606.96]